MEMVKEFTRREALTIQPHKMALWLAPDIVRYAGNGSEELS
jgi:hypothetical protein